jgi:hypothetical protein
VKDALDDGSMQSTFKTPGELGHQDDLAAEPMEGTSCSASLPPPNDADSSSDALCDRAIGGAFESVSSRTESELSGAPATDTPVDAPDVLRVPISRIRRSSIDPSVHRQLLTLRLDEPAPESPPALTPSGGLHPSKCFPYAEICRVVASKSYAELGLDPSILEVRLVLR